MYIDKYNLEDLNTIKELTIKRMSRRIENDSYFPKSMDQIPIVSLVFIELDNYKHLSANDNNILNGLVLSDLYKKYKKEIDRRN